MLTNTITCTAASPKTAGRRSRVIRAIAGWRRSRDGATSSPHADRLGSCTRSWPTPPASTPIASDTIGGSRCPASRSDAADHADVQDGRADRAGEESPVRVENARGHRGEADEQQIREHEPRQGHRQRRLGRVVQEARRDERARSRARIRYPAPWSPSAPAAPTPARRGASAQLGPVVARPRSR